MNVLIDTSVWSLALRRKAPSHAAVDTLRRVIAGGRQGSNTDFLMCAVCVRHRMPLLTTDADFARFAEVIPVTLHPHGP